MRFHFCTNVTSEYEWNRCLNRMQSGNRMKGKHTINIIGFRCGVLSEIFQSQGQVEGYLWCIDSFWKESLRMTRTHTNTLCYICNATSMENPEHLQKHGSQKVNKWICWIRKELGGFSRFSNDYFFPYEVEEHILENKANANDFFFRCFICLYLYLYISMEVYQCINEIINQYWFTHVSCLKIFCHTQIIKKHIALNMICLNIKNRFYWKQLRLRTHKWPVKSQNDSRMNKILVRI